MLAKLLGKDDSFLTHLISVFSFLGDLISAVLNVSRKRRFFSLEIQRVTHPLGFADMLQSTS